MKITGNKIWQITMDVSGVGIGIWKPEGNQQIRQKIAKMMKVIVTLCIKIIKEC